MVPCQINLVNLRSPNPYLHTWGMVLQALSWGYTNCSYTSRYARPFPTYAGRYTILGKDSIAWPAYGVGDTCETSILPFRMSLGLYLGYIQQVKLIKDKSRPHPLYWMWHMWNRMSDGTQSVWGHQCSGLYQMWQLHKSVSKRCTHNGVYDLTSP